MCHVHMFQLFKVQVTPLRGTPGQLARTRHCAAQPTDAVPWLCEVHSWPQQQQPEIPTDLDAVVVLAGGLLRDGKNPPWVTRRLDAAAGIHKIQANPTHCPILCLGMPPPVLTFGAACHSMIACATCRRQDACLLVAAK
jgi:hypothetical protein